MSEEIIDLPDVMERVQDDKELLLELLDIFQEDFQKKRQVLVDAVAAGNIEKVKETAHSIKGSSGNISAKPMHASCLKLEQLAKSGNTTGMSDLITVIDSQFEQVKAYAAKLKKEWA
jgi:HPt (histidine-containing phosphotransfer) domain-containing protein